MLRIDNRDLHVLGHLLFRFPKKTGQIVFTRSSPLYSRFISLCLREFGSYVQLCEPSYLLIYSTPLLNPLSTGSSIIIFPLIFNYILVDKIVQPPQSPHKRDDHRYESILEARAIGFGVFVGTLVFFLVPYLVWKMLVCDLFLVMSPLR